MPQSPSSRSNLGAVTTVAGTVRQSINWHKSVALEVPGSKHKAQRYAQTHMCNQEANTAENSGPTQDSQYLVEVYDDASDGKPEGTKSPFTVAPNLKRITPLKCKAMTATDLVVLKCVMFRRRDEHACCKRSSRRGRTLPLTHLIPVLAGPTTHSRIAAWQSTQRSGTSFGSLSQGRCV